MKAGGRTRVLKLAWIALVFAGLVAGGCGSADAQRGGLPPIGTPMPVPDFHFADPTRDARYWQLQGDAERAEAVFREAAFAAIRALAAPGPQPGSPEWQQARTLVERALLARRPARDAINALIFYLRRERPQLTAAEAEEADNIIRVHEEWVLASSDRLVDLFAHLAGVRIGQWPP